MCGLVGIRFFAQPTVDIRELSMELLSRLQHRGQDGAGLSVLDSQEGAFHSARGLGLVDIALKDWRDLPQGSVAIAHTRYATTGKGGVGEIQPFVKGAPKLALAHNGNIVNTAELIAKHNLEVETDSDLDVLLQYFLKKQLELGFVSAVEGVLNEFVGAYAVLGIEQTGTLFGFRDPFGIRPLFLARTKSWALMASETTVLTAMQMFNESFEIEEIAPGEWVRVNPNGEISRGKIISQMNVAGKERGCMFESVYFASPLSEIKKESVFKLRFRLGQELAFDIKQELRSVDELRKEFDFVVPVPETSRAAAIAVAETLNIAYREYLVKNPYVPRTFILGRQDLRLRALNMKLGLVGPEIRGKKILLVDDSIVRGNTAKMMAARLKEAGAERIVLASTCPPIKYGCFYGIDFPDAQELVANGCHTHPEIAKALGVDRVFYIQEASLKRALGTDQLCMACLDGDYPSRSPSFDKFLESRRTQRTEKSL